MNFILGTKGISFDKTLRAIGLSSNKTIPAKGVTVSMDTSFTYEGFLPIGGDFVSADFSPSDFSTP